MARNFLVGDYFLNRRKLRYWKKGYCSLVLWMSSTAPRKPMIIAAGKSIEGNSGVGVTCWSVKSKSASLSAGAAWGDRLMSPLLYHTLILNFISMEKEFYGALFSSFSCGSTVSFSLVISSLLEEFKGNSSTKKIFFGTL